MSCSVYWYWVRLSRPPIWMLCDRLQIGRDPGDLRELWPQSLDDLTLGCLALVPWLETDEQAAGIDSGARAAADSGADGCDIGVFQDDRGRPLLQIGHPHEGNVRRGLGEAEDHPGVLFGEEALRDGHDQPAGERDQREIDQHRPQAESARRTSTARS